MTGDLLSSLISQNELAVRDGKLEEDALVAIFHTALRTVLE
jgi:hypothetical protein